MPRTLAADLVPRQPRAHGYDRAPNPGAEPMPSAPVLAAFDPVTCDSAPVRFAAAVAGYTGAPLLVGSVLGGEARVDRLAAGQLAEEPAELRTEALDRAVRDLRAEG